MQVSVDKCIFKWSDISRLDIAQYYCSLFNIYKIHFPFSGGLQNYYSYGKKREIILKFNMTEPKSVCV